MALVHISRRTDASVRMSSFDKVSGGYNPLVIVMVSFRILGFLPSVGRFMIVSSNLTLWTCVPVFLQGGRNLGSSHRPHDRRRKNSQRRMIHMPVPVYSMYVRTRKLTSERIPRSTLLNVYFLVCYCLLLFVDTNEASSNQSNRMNHSSRFSSFSVESVVQ